MSHSRKSENTELFVSSIVLYFCCFIISDFFMFSISGSPQQAFSWCFLPTKMPVKFGVLCQIRVPVRKFSNSPICTELGKAPVASPHRAEYTPRKCQEKRIIFLIVCFFCFNLFPLQFLQKLLRDMEQEGKMHKR